MSDSHSGVPSQPQSSDFGKFTPGLVARLRAGVLLIGAALAVMWLVELVDAILLDDRLEGGGIHPRRLDGIDGILWAPFLHGGVGHLVSNTVPFAALGALVMIHGRRRWFVVIAMVIVGGGALTWLFARGGNHIGASGVVFGLFGYLGGAAFTSRRGKAVVTGIVAVALYGGLVWGFLPSPGVSWEGHLFGFAAGVGAAFALGPDTAASPPAGRSGRLQ